MLNNRIINRPLYKPTITKNSLNENVIIYNKLTDIGIAISFNNKSLYQTNNANIINCQYIGVTQYKNIQKGDKIDKYIVEFIQENKGNYYIWLNEVNNNGRA